MFSTLSLLDPFILWCLFGYLWGIVFAILRTIFLYHLLITWSGLNSFMTYPSSLILRQFILPNIWSSLAFVNGVIKRISIICNTSTQLVFTHSLRNNLFQTSRWFHGILQPFLISWTQCFKPLPFVGKEIMIKH